MDVHDLLTRLERATVEYRAAQAAAQEHGAVVVRTARAQLGLTQRQLADQLAVDPTYLSKIENGHVRPGRPVLTALALLLADRSVDRSAVDRVRPTDDA